MNVLVVLPTAIECVSFLLDCVSWAREPGRSATVEVRYTASDSLRMHVGDSVVSAVTPRLFDAALDVPYSFALLCGLDGAEDVLADIAPMLADTSETRVQQHAPDISELMSGLIAIESARNQGDKNAESDRAAEPAAT